jgi:transketolase
MSWQHIVGSTGGVVGISTFGASAPYQTLYEEYGITAKHAVALAESLL